MSIIFALALAAAPVAQSPAPGAVDHRSQHANHMKEMQKHHDACRDMMAKMHHGADHRAGAKSSDTGATMHKDHAGH